MNEQIKKDKVYIEKAERVRFIVQQEVGLGKVLDCLSEKFKVEIFEKNGEIVILIEEHE